MLRRLRQQPSRSTSERVQLPSSHFETRSFEALLNVRRANARERRTNG